MINILLTLLGKLTLLASQILKLGSGSTWPGHVAMETNPKFLSQILEKNKNLKIILIAGTNGKTTTSLMLQRILERKGLKAFRNEAGANLLNGLASTVIKNSNILGKINADVAIFELDENNVKLALDEITPYAIIFLNIFRDQLDRYGEVNKIAKDWQNTLKTVSKDTALIVNGDDPELTFIAKESGLKTFYFGIDENEMKHKSVGHDTDFNYCPNCGTELEYTKVSYTHMGTYKCPTCKFAKPKFEVVKGVNYPLFGQYNIYNTNAAVVAAQKLFDVSKDEVNEALEKFKPAFGRQEKIKYRGRDVIVLLSKNPAGFNQSIQAITDLNKRCNVLIVLNDRIPDGRDVSWIWDVDFENLPKESKIFVSGDRVYDMGLRIKYSERNEEALETRLFENLEQAITSSIEETQEDETLVILPTYSAMLDARRILTGKAIL